MIDPEGGPFTISGSFKYNGGGVINLPSGILTFPAADTLNIASTAASDVGIYEITLYVTDPGGLKS